MTGTTRQEPGAARMSNQLTIKHLKRLRKKIELKTGKKQEGDLTEAELYAFGIWKRFAEEEKKDVTVLHVYVNEAKDEPVTRRFGEEEFKTIEKKFLSYAEKIASWNPLDALSVDHSQGSCCDYCEFKQTCAEFR